MFSRDERAKAAHEARLIEAASARRLNELSFVEQRAALNLAQLAGKEVDLAVPADGIQNLILTLTVRTFLG